MTAVVFIGPSLDAGQARALLAAEFRPPAVRGDVDRLLDRDVRPEVIGLVDGGRPAVSPKEILRALDAGIAVYGSSGAGALRAVECAPFGMIGVGRIYQEYASGRVDADHLVETGDGTARPPIDELLPSATRDDTVALLRLIAGRP